MITDWRAKAGHEWRVVTKSPDGEPHDWTEGGKVQLRKAGTNRSPATIYVDARNANAGAIEIWTEDGMTELLSESAREALVNAVSMTTMPVVRFRDDRLE